LAEVRISVPAMIDCLLMVGLCLLFLHKYMEENVEVVI